MTFFYRGAGLSVEPGTGMIGTGFVFEAAKRSSYKLGAGLSKATAFRSVSVHRCIAFHPGLKVMQKLQRGDCEKHSSVFFLACRL